MTNSEQERQLEVAYEAEELLRTLDLRCVEPTRFLFDAWRAGRDHLDNSEKRPSRCGQ